MLLVTDRNIAQLDGVQQIRALLEKHCPQVNVIDNVPAEPTDVYKRQVIGSPARVLALTISGDSLDNAAFCAEVAAACKRL